MTVGTLLTRRPIPAAKQPVPYVTIAAIVFAGLFLGSIAYFCAPVAAILYVPLYLVLCHYQPGMALWIMFAEVPFPYNVAGSDAIHMAPAEISLCLAYPIFWLRAYSARQPHVSNPIFIPVILYFLICAVSSLVHFTGRDAIVSILQMCIYLVVAVKFFSTCVRDPKLIRCAWGGLIASCTFFSIMLLVNRSDDVLGVHKNATGSFLSFSVLVLAEIWLSASSTKSRKWWMGLLLAINVGGLVMSTSRGAWMGAFAGLIVLLICRRQYGLFGKALLVMIPAIILCWLLVPPDQRQYALSIDATTNSTGSRLNTIAIYKEQFFQSPIIGSGIGLRKEIDSTNIIMSTLAETGVIGLAAFLAIHAVLLWSLYKGTRLAPREHVDMTLLGLGMALVVCLFVHGCVDHYWARTQLPVWGMAGAGIAVRGAQRAMMGPRRSHPRIAPLVPAPK